MKIRVKRLPLISSFVLFITFCVSAAYWAMHMFKPPARPVVAPQTAAAAPPPPALDEAAALFGGRSSIAVASNFQLKGVVVSGNPAESIAILAADGKPARSVKTGAEVIPGVTLNEVQRTHVLLSVGGAIKRVDLPEKGNRK